MDAVRYVVTNDIMLCMHYNSTKSHNRQRRTRHTISGPVHWCRNRRPRAVKVGVNVMCMIQQQNARNTAGHSNSPHCSPTAVNLRPHNKLWLSYDTTQLQQLGGGPNSAAKQHTQHAKSGIAERAFSSVHPWQCQCISSSNAADSTPTHRYGRVIRPLQQAPLRPTHPSPFPVNVLSRHGTQPLAHRPSHVTPHRLHPNAASQ